MSEHVNIDEELSGEIKKPFCTIDLPFSMNAYDHLKGVALRHVIDNSSELGLINILPNIIADVKSVDEFGNIVGHLLEKVIIIKNLFYASG